MMHLPKALPLALLFSIPLIAMDKPVQVNEEQVFTVQLKKDKDGKEVREVTRVTKAAVVEAPKALNWSKDEAGKWVGAQQAETSTPNTPASNVLMRTALFADSVVEGQQRLAAIAAAKAKLAEEQVVEEKKVQESIAELKKRVLNKDVAIEGNRRLLISQTKEQERIAQDIKLTTENGPKLEADKKALIDSINYQVKAEADAKAAEAAKNPKKGWFGW